MFTWLRRLIHRAPGGGTGAASAQSSSATGTLPGVDVASYQGTPSQWRGLAGSISWAAVKITELQPGGTRYVNPDAGADWSYLHRAGHGRIGYLFGHPSASASQTVSFFVGELRKLGLKDSDGVALDLETTDGRGPSAVSAWAADVLADLKRQLGRDPVVYTYISFAEDGNCAGLGRYPLWISDPSSSAGHPRVPAPWHNWAIHQYSITGQIDKDVARYPDLAAMAAALGASLTTSHREDQDVFIDLPPGSHIVVPVWPAANAAKLTDGPNKATCVLAGIQGAVVKVHVRDQSGGFDEHYQLTEAPVLIKPGSLAKVSTLAFTRTDSTDAPASAVITRWR